MSDTELKSYKTEIARHEERLVGVRNEVDALEKQRTVLRNEIQAKEDHLKYLEGLEKRHTTEITRKEDTIGDLDQQIIALQNKADTFAQNASASALIVEEKHEELIKIEAKILEHNGLMQAESKHIARRRVETDSNHAEIEAKKEKLRTFLAEM